MTLVEMFFFCLQTDIHAAAVACLLSWNTMGVCGIVACQRTSWQGGLPERCPPWAANRRTSRARRWCQHTSHLQTPATLIPNTVYPGSLFLTKQENFQLQHLFLQLLVFFFHKHVGFKYYLSISGARANRACARTFTYAGCFKIYLRRCRIY